MTRTRAPVPHHAFASCADCDFEDDDYQTAWNAGRRHAKKTGHRVSVDIGRTYEYGGAAR